MDIIKDLAHRGLLFAKAKYEHSYPHCWRYKTKVIYYAKDSWYIRMSELRDELLAQTPTSTGSRIIFVMDDSGSGYER